MTKRTTSRPKTSRPARRGNTGLVLLAGVATLGIVAGAVGYDWLKSRAPAPAAREATMPATRSPVRMADVPAPVPAKPPLPADDALAKLINARTIPADVSKPPKTAAPREKMSSASWQDLDQALAKQLKQCWIQPARVADYVPKLKIEFARDGSLTGAPMLLNPGKDAAGKRLAQQASDALAQCKALSVPTRFQAYYDEWKTRVVHFDSAT